MRPRFVWLMGVLAITLKMSTAEQAEEFLDDSFIGQCQQEEYPQMVPPDYNFLPAEEYRNTKSRALQIFASSRVACNGYLRSWRFIAMNAEIDNLHLGIFRLSTDQKTFNLVNQTTVRLMLEEIEGGVDLIRKWIAVNLPTPVPVKMGDYLGVYYDTFKIARKKLTIATRMVNEDDPAGEQDYTTYLFKQDDRSLKKEDGTYRPLEIRSAKQHRSIPALVALVVDGPSKMAGWPSMTGERDPSSAMALSDSAEEDLLNGAGSGARMEPERIVKTTTIDPRDVVGALRSPTAIEFKQLMTGQVFILGSHSPMQVASIFVVALFSFLASVLIY